MTFKVIIVLISTLFCMSCTNDSKINNNKPTTKEVVPVSKNTELKTNSEKITKIDNPQLDKNIDSKDKTDFNKDNKPSEPIKSSKKPSTAKASNNKPVESKAKSDAVVIDVKSMPAPTATSATKPKVKPEKINTIPKITKTAPLQKPVLSHTIFDKFLNDNIKGSNVDYKGMVGDRLALEKYLQILADNPVQSNWSKSKKMAYWINAYNAFTIKLILNNYPIKSITKLDNGKPWDRKWIKLGGKTLSLNDIENNILRPQFNDARIHFAVNCAAKSCPPIWNHAWTASNLNSTLDKRAKAFINGKLNTISADHIQVSKIFDWYKADFGNLIEYLNKYSTTKINADAKIDYVEYDWSLNGE